MLHDLLTEDAEVVQVGDVQDKVPVEPAQRHLLALLLHEEVQHLEHHPVSVARIPMQVCVPQFEECLLALVQV